MKFTPLKNFSDPDLRSEYLVGLNYTVHVGNDLLAAKVEQWIKVGRVREGTADGTTIASARVNGVGIVT